VTAREADPPPRGRIPPPSARRPRWLGRGPRRCIGGGTTTWQIGGRAERAANRRRRRSHWGRDSGVIRARLICSMAASRAAKIGTEPPVRRQPVAARRYRPFGVTLDVVRMRRRGSQPGSSTNAGSKAARGRTGRARSSRRRDRLGAPGPPSGASVMAWTAFAPDWKLDFLVLAGIS